MPTQPGTELTFSPRRRWQILLNVALSSVIVLAVVVMVNYLSRSYFTRLHWGGQSKTELSPLTVKFLGSLTNQVKITLFYDKTDPLYGIVANLLNEYHLANPGITVHAADYIRDAGLAQSIRAEYNLGTGVKDVILFDCPGTGQRLTFSGRELTRGVAEWIRSDTKLGLMRRPTEFLGERAFTSAILAVTNPKKLKACFLEDHHGEQSILAGDEFGFRTFKSVLEQNSIRTEALSLLGTNPIPADCNLLVVAGPTDPYSGAELQKIDQYLSQGGRLLALFRFSPAHYDSGTGLVRGCGLEELLQKWGVDVGNSVILDPEYSVRGEGRDISIWNFDPTHPAVNPLISSRLQMIQPRKVASLRTLTQTADAPRVQELAFTGKGSFTTADRRHKQSYPVMVAVENAIRGVSPERGSTRMLIVGNSYFLANGFIEEVPGNRAFAGYAANWLLDRMELLQGIGPRPIGHYDIVMTKAQAQATRWLLLAGMPGSVLLIGGVVWLFRRR